MAKCVGHGQCGALISPFIWFLFLFKSNNLCKDVFSDGKDSQQKACFVGVRAWENN
jgi:hypothetical protein